MTEDKCAMIKILYLTICLNKQKGLVQQTKARTWICFATINGLSGYWGSMLHLRDMQMNLEKFVKLKNGIDVVVCCVKLIGTVLWCL